MRRHSQRRSKRQKHAVEQSKLNPVEQLAALDKRLGVGVGATKERARLLKKIEG